MTAGQLRWFILAWLALLALALPAYYGGLFLCALSVTCTAGAERWFGLLGDGAVALLWWCWLAVSVVSGVAAMGLWPVTKLDG